MKRIALGIFVGVSAFVVLSGEARSATPTDSAAAPSPVIEIDDVARFYQVYEPPADIQPPSSFSTTISIPARKAFIILRRREMLPGLSPRNGRAS